MLTVLHQIAGEIKLLLVNNVHEKTSQKVKRGEILKVSAPFVICIVLQLLTLVLHENALIFSLSEVWNFFMCIVNGEIKSSDVY